MTWIRWAAMIALAAALALGGALGGAARSEVPDAWWSNPLPPDLLAIVVRDVQTQLVNLGCYTGAVDGQANAETAEAIRRWQAANGYPVTGIVSEPLVTVLLTQAPWDLIGCPR